MIIAIIQLCAEFMNLSPPALHSWLFGLFLDGYVFACMMIPSQISFEHDCVKFTYLTSMHNFLGMKQIFDIFLLTPSLLLIVCITCMGCCFCCCMDALQS